MQGLDPTSIAKELVIGSESFKSLKDHWRYTTIVNGVAGTPIFYANGVRVDGAEDFTYLDWINFIKQYKAVTSNLRIYEWYSIYGRYYNFYPESKFVSLTW